MDKRRQKLMLFAERASWAIGLAGVIWLGALPDRGCHFGTAESRTFRGASAPPLVEPDQSLWSAIRINAWHNAIREPAATPLAVLRIPKIRLEVAVLPGTDDRTLDRAVGHIEDTAAPGTDGNTGLAGHRDGFFRGLKDIAPGDAIVLETLDGTETYRSSERGSSIQMTCRCWIQRPPGR